MRTFRGRTEDEQRAVWRERSRQWRETHPDYQRDYQRRPDQVEKSRMRQAKRYADPARRADAIRYSLERARSTLDRIDEIKVAAGCVDCRYNAHPQALHFDHIPDRGPKFTDISLMQTYAWHRIEAEMQKCEVVCANCHAIRTAQRRA